MMFQRGSLVRRAFPRRQSQEALEPIRRDELIVRQDSLQLLPHHLGRWLAMIAAGTAGLRIRRQGVPRGGVAFNPKRLHPIAQSFILRGPSG
jgi:hypothetical protein